MLKLSFLPFLPLFAAAVLHAAPVSTPAALLEAVADAESGSVIELAAGRFELSAPLELKAGLTLKGAGIGKTIVTHTSGWKANPGSLPDPETNFKKFDSTGYLIILQEKAGGITVSDMTLTGPQVHGGIFGRWENTDLHLHDLRFEDFMFAGFRSYTTSGAKIHDCEFVDAGQRWEKGKPGLKGGITGGGIFVVWIKDSEIFNNRFLDTKKEAHLHYYGIKGRQGKRLRIHHNTIETNFSIEFAHENDEDVEIDHNILLGTVSIPKGGGGAVPESGKTFHIHHNYFTTGYAIEFPRNGAEIDHNLFDFDAEKDGGNLISGFGGRASAGPASFHNNVVSNPGRGVIWIERPFNGMVVRNNHILARPTPTPRKEGLFGYDGRSDFSTHVFKDNIIECVGTPRPLFRNDESGKAKISNNLLKNVSDTQRYSNPKGRSKPGLESPLSFECGVDGEMMVRGSRTKMK